MFTSKRKNNPDGSHTTHIMRTKPLMLALNFGNEELDANRSGHMSTWQQLDFQWVQRRNLGLALVVSIVPAIWIIGHVILLAHNNAAISRYIVIMAIFLLALGYSGLILWHEARTQNLLRRNQVHSLHGIVERYSREGARGATSYEVRIDDDSFRVGRRIHDAFIGGENYILYYLAGTHYLLSAEAIGEHVPTPSATVGGNTGKPGV